VSATIECIDCGHPIAAHCAVRCHYWADGAAGQDCACSASNRVLSGDLNTFYEDDEPVADVLAAFGPGPHPVTESPYEQD
jgi:hypothetical protein